MLFTFGKTGPTYNEAIMSPACGLWLYAEGRDASPKVMGSQLESWIDSIHGKDFQPMKKELKRLMKLSVGVVDVTGRVGAHQSS